MNHYDNDQAEAFLIEAQLIHQKVKALAQNRLSPQQFDKLEQARAEDLNRRLQAKKRKQKQAIQKKIRGRQGKGISTDFANFCKFCRIQYEIQTKICLKCDRNTMTLQQRRHMLQQMVGDYKYKKRNRQQRKNKWDLWQKTQAMLWKKTSNHYTKWEYFVSDSEQQAEQQPIVPKNDPNFRALQIDMQQRKKRRQNDTQKAKKLKQKGNQSMKQQDYQKAMQYYTLALQHIKDMKVIYTNRALAYIKLKKYKKAIKDCSNVIQYMEVFQKTGEHKDLAFKAFSRRALANKQLKQYNQALKDIKQSLAMIPNDNNALMLKKQIEGYIEHTQTINKLLRQNKQEEKKHNKRKQQVQAQKEQLNRQQDEQEQSIGNKDKLDKQIIKQLAERELQQQRKKPQQIVQQSTKQHTSTHILHQIQNNPINFIPQIIETLAQRQVQALVYALSKNKQFISIFISSKGIQQSLTKLMASSQQNKLALLICICLGNNGVGQNYIYQFGVNKLHAKVIEILLDKSALNMQKYWLLEDICEILIELSLHQKFRELISNEKHTEIFIEKVYPTLITKDKKQTRLLNSFILYMSNLCYGEKSGIKTKYITNQLLLTIVDSLYLRILKTFTQNRAYLDLKQNVYNLISNILTHFPHRQTIAQSFTQNTNNQDSFGSFLIHQLETYPFTRHNFGEYIENILSIFVNITLGTNLQIIPLTKVLFSRFIASKNKFTAEIIYRSLLVISRIKYKQNIIQESWLISLSKLLEQCRNQQINEGKRDNLNQIIRILYIMYSCGGNQLHKYTQKPPQKILHYSVQFIASKSQKQQVFCNTCNLFGIWLDLPNSIAWKSQVFKLLKPKIKQLIFVAKQKTGNWRKNAAILLAKCAKDEQCRQQLVKQHGMDVLKSVAHLVVQK